MQFPVFSLHVCDIIAGKKSLAFKGRKSGILPESELYLQINNLFLLNKTGDRSFFHEDTPTFVIFLKYKNKQNGSKKTLQSSHFLL